MSEWVFRGTSALALDAKGRINVPVRHRDPLMAACNGQLTLTRHPEGYLLIYPRPVWEPIQARLMALSSFNEPIRRLQRLLVGHADDVEMDNAGRILVSPALRQYAGLDHRVVLVGQGNRFELWDETRWQDETAQAITFSTGALPTELDGFSL